MTSTSAIQSAIRTDLIEKGPCTLQALLNRLPQYSWSEVFTAIDQLSREGSLVLRHPTRFDYEVSVTPVQPTFQPSANGSDVGGDDELPGRSDVGSLVHKERVSA